MNNLEKYEFVIKKLKKEFLSFIDDILDVFPNNTDILLNRIFAYQLSENMLIENLYKNINFECIENRNEYYLINELVFFKSEEFINKEKYIFKNIWNTDGMNETNKELIWKWMNMIIFLIKTAKKIDNDF